MTAFAPVARAAAEGAPAAWRAHLAASALLAGWILLVFRRDAADMAAIWWTSASYNHCLLVLPLLGWLVWLRAPRLRALRPAAFAPGLLLVAAGGAAWLAGEAGGVALARHAGLVVMLQGAVVASLGTAVTRALAFPLFYLLFLVPAGEQLVPALQTITARISIFLLGAVGVPAHLDGIYLTTPSGYFKVAEACSGIEFVIAMTAFGALVANVCFRSARRRILFLAASLALPVLANGLRAAAVIFIAHHGSIEFAASRDHVLFGWVLFAVVVALLLGLAWPFFDRRPGEAWFDPIQLQPRPPRPRPRLLAANVFAVFLLAAAPSLWFQAAARGPDALPASISLPQVPGWTRIPVADERPWRPRFAGADLSAIGRYRDSAGREVDLAISIYAIQTEGRELVGHGQGAAGLGTAWAWTEDRSAPPGGRAERIASFGQVREVVSFYRVGNSVTGSEARVKLETMESRLFGGPQKAVAILVSARADAAGEARPAIDSFLSALGPVAPFADRIAEKR